MHTNRRENHEREVRFYYVRSSQVLKEKRVPLQESNRGIYQVREQYGECKYQKYAPGGIENRDHDGKEQDCKQYVCGATIGESHRFTCYQIIGAACSEKEFFAKSWPLADNSKFLHP